MGGSLSGEHGDGQARGELLPIMFGDRIVEGVRGVQGDLGSRREDEPGQGRQPQPDPVRPSPRHELRATRSRDTTSSYPDDHGSFAHAAFRCVGVGECRRHGGGTMCPSYMVTREEKHSTRGRARLLFEMMQGGDLKGGWRTTAVREALDLCLACKGCKGDCPVNVDMATYKAEFMAHH